MWQVLFTTIFKAFFLTFALAKLLQPCNTLPKAKFNFSTGQEI
jgi:hypothetical protein